LTFLADDQNLIRVHFDVALSDDIPHELASGDSEGAFLRVQLNAEQPKVVEGFFHIGNEAAALLRFHRHKPPRYTIFAPSAYANFHEHPCDDMSG
jgi:hypothetical protein